MFDFIKKDKFESQDSNYLNQRSSFMKFIFLPYISENMRQRNNKWKKTICDIAGKQIFTIDEFFLLEEINNLSEFSKKTSFSRKSYGSIEGIQNGENPALSMDPKERWDFFFNPPKPIFLVYELFSYFSAVFDVEVTLMPWDLFDGVVSSPATIANKVYKVSEESMLKGVHKDYNPKNKLPFIIPNLYQSKFPHLGHFENGQQGKPYMLSLILYSTENNFLPSFRTGTIFLSSDKKIEKESICVNGGMVLFEGDIDHSLAMSSIPEIVDTWRVSYVYKIILNPKKENLNLNLKLLDFFSL